MPSRDDDRVLLAEVQALTFTRGVMTNSHRTHPYPQLVCDSRGTAGCPREHEYQFKTAICNNVGLGDDGEPRWACTVPNLPNDVNLGVVLVACEGYTYTYDPYILVGSCNLTYTLEGQKRGSVLGGLFLFLCFICCCCCCATKKRGRDKWRAPPPSYCHVVPGTAEPITATAVPVDSHGKATSTAYGTTGRHGDPEFGARPSAPAKPTTTASDGYNTTMGTFGKASNLGSDNSRVDGEASASSKSSGGMGKGAAVAVGAAAAATAAVAATAVAAGRHGQAQGTTVENLPQGWEAMVDPRTGNTFYVDHTSKKTSWAPPQLHDTPEYNPVLNNAAGGQGRRYSWGSGVGGAWGSAWTRHAPPSADRRSHHPQGNSAAAGPPSASGQPGCTGQIHSQTNEKHSLLGHHGGAFGTGWGSGLGGVWKNLVGRFSNDDHSDSAHQSAAQHAAPAHQTQGSGFGGWALGLGAPWGNGAGGSLGGGTGNDWTRSDNSGRAPHGGGVGVGGGGGHSSTSFGGTHRR